MTLVYDRLLQVNSQGVLGQTELFGQTFRAWAADLATIEVGIDVEVGSPLVFKLLIAELGPTPSGTRLTNVIYTGAPITVPGDADRDFAVISIPVSGLNLTPGTIYGFVLDSEGSARANLATSFVAPFNAHSGLGINQRGQEVIVGSGPIPGNGYSFDNGSDLAFRMTYGRNENDKLDFATNTDAQAIYADLGAGQVFDGKGGQPSATGKAHVVGGTGADAIVGDGANNQLKGGAGVDTIFGGHWSGTPASGDDLVEGGDGNDGIWGFDGRDDIRGQGGDDGIVGGSGDDTIEGGDGVDVLFGGEFTAGGAFAAGSGVDQLFGGAGGDGLWGFDGGDVLHGGEGDDYIEGNQGDDYINGGDGNDTIIAGAGDDIIGGGTGFDYIYGGSGADLFLIQIRDAADVIWDFSVAEGDQILLDAFLKVETFTEFKSLLTGYRFEGADYTVATIPRVLDEDGSVDQITIKGIASTAWTSDLVIIPTNL